MKTPSIAEFARLRFVKDRGNGLVNLPANGVDEQVILALDCGTFRLVRLHIFEGAALRPDKLEAFEEEMQQIANLKVPGVSKIISWGRDDDELFFADEMQDGEPLPDYFQRTGGISFSTAADWILHLGKILESCDVLPPTLERFSNLNIQVTSDRFGNIFPGFSEFYAWTKPGIQKSAHSREWMLAQVFCAAIVGVPSRVFSRGNLPRNFDQLPESVQEEVLNALDKNGSSAYEDLKREMRSLVGSDAEDPPAHPISAIREWLGAELDASYRNNPEYELTGDIASEDLRYASEATLKGQSALIQVVPGKESVPRIGWFNQHHDATRRPGRGMMHQLTVQMIEDRGGVSLIGEERPEGIDLEQLVNHTGPLEIPNALELLKRVSITIDAMENSSGSAPVWWVPPSAVFAISGTRTGKGTARLMRRKGADLWKDIPFRLRLHQTVASLLDGVDLPESLLELCNDPAKKKNVEMRRSAVLLYLLWYLLTGKFLDWNEELEADGNVNETAAGVLESYRIRLVQSPISCRSPLIKELEDALKENDSESLVQKKLPEDIPEIEEEEDDESPLSPVSEATEIKEATTEEKTGLNHTKSGASELQEILGATLYGELIDLDDIEEVIEEQDEEGDTVEIEEEDEAIVEVEEIAPAPEKKRTKAFGFFRKKKKEEPEPDVEAPEVDDDQDDLEEEPADIDLEEEDEDTELANVEVEEDELDSEDVVDPEAASASDKTEDQEEDPEIEDKVDGGKGLDEPEKLLLPFKIGSLAFDTVKVGRDGDVVSDFTENEGEDDSDSSDESGSGTSTKPKPSGKGSSGLSMWIGAMMLGLLGAAGFGSVAHGWASNAGPYAEVSEEFPLTGYVARLNRVKPFADLDHTTPYRGAVSESESANSFDDVDQSQEKSLSVAKEVQKKKHFAEAVELCLDVLSQNPADRTEVHQVLEESLNFWIDELSAAENDAESFDPAKYPLLAQYFLQQNRVEGLRILTCSALREDSGISFRILGLLYLQGQILPKDEEWGVDCLIQAVDRGDRDAQFLLAEGELTERSDWFSTGLAMNAIQKTAAAGHALSQELLGVSLITGKGIEKDSAKGFVLIKSSAEKGNPGAMYHLGLCHASGTGTEKNPGTAAKIFQKAAELGDIRAMHQYGRCLAAGFGTQSSWPLACRWIKKAAMAGHLPARDWCQKRRLDMEF